MNQPQTLPWIAITLLLLLSACSTGKPTIKLSATPTSLEDGQEVTLSAEVKGAQKVEFFKGTIKAGEDSSAPYELKLPLTSDTDATLSFTAKATAANQQFALSEPVSVQVKVDKEAPKVSLAASSSTLNAAGAVTLTANATDNKGVVKVEFFKGGDKLGEDATPADGFSLVVNLSAEHNGSLKYIAKAHDNKGNVGTSAEVSVVVDIDTIAPTISLSSDKTTVTATGSATLTAEAGDNIGVVKVEFFKGSDKIGEDTEAPFTYLLSFSADNNGTHTYTAKAYDAKNNSTTSNAVTLTVDIDVTKPEVSLGASKTTITQPGPVLLTATASDNKSVSKVEFFKGSEKIAEDLEAPFTREVNFNATHNGTHSYTAKAFDPSGNSAESSPVNITVDIDVDAPVVSLSANPAALSAKGSIALTATASDNKGVSKVEFYKNGNKIADDTTKNDGFSLQVSYDNSYKATDSFSAKAYDADNNMGTSNTVNVAIDIDIDAPTVSLSAPAKITAPGNLTLTAISSDNMGVSKLEIYRTSPTSELIETILNPAASEAYSGVSFDKEHNGTYKYKVKAYDAKNNATDSNEVTVEVEIKPSITKFEIAQGSSLNVSDAGGTVDLVWNGNFVQSYTLEVSPGDATASINAGGNTAGKVTVPANFTDQAKTYTVTLRAKAYGNSGIADDTKQLSITVAKDTTPPSEPTLSKDPTYTITDWGSVVTLTADATDGAGIKKVEFYEVLGNGTTQLIGTDTDGSNHFQHPISYTAAHNGTHTYKAVVFDSWGNSSESNTESVSVDIRGSLSVTISGLPNGISGSVGVAGPDGFSQTLTATTTLTDLKPGTYTLTPTSVDSGDYSYGAASSTVEVTGNGTNNATVTYAANTGALTITITGLPSGNVTVTGPNSYSKTLNATTTLKQLLPGNYTITAPTVAGYTRTITGSPASVVAGNTATASVGYVGGPGSLDTAFGSAGKVTTSLVSGNDQASAIAVQSDGKLVVAGSSGSPGSFDFSLVRYNSDGSPDSSFGSGGKVMTSVGPSSNDEAYAVAVQPNGKILLAGSSYTTSANSYDIALLRYNSDGSLDTSFDTDGMVITNLGSGRDDRARAIALKSDGTIVLAGFTNSLGDYDFVLMRFNTDGSLDNSFDADGKVITAFGSTTHDHAHALVLQSDGKIVVTGASYSGSNADIALARYNSDGSLDTGFDGDGKLTTAIGSASEWANAVVIDSNNKIVVAGASNFDFALVRYNSDGSLDTSFHGDGVVTTFFGIFGSNVTSETVYGLAIQSDGKIVAAGSRSSAFALARYNSDGSLDDSFDGDSTIPVPGYPGNGLVYTQVSPSENQGQAMVILPDGKIVLAGYSGNHGAYDFTLVRYNP